MVNRRLSLISHLETEVLRLHENWGSSLQFESPPRLDGKLGFDLAIPCFPMAKVEKKPPAKIAEGLAKELESAKETLGIELVEAVNAYVNLRFKSELLGQCLMEQRGHPLASSELALRSERLVVDYSSPNIAKPFGIGHLRSTNIGAAICRIFKALGAHVIRVNHIGDWGTQFGKLIVAYKRFGSAEFVKGDPINNLFKLYVEFHEKERDDPALLDEAREWFVKLEKGDEEARELWTWFKDVSYHEFKKIYDRLGVDFDFVTGESFYNQLMEESVERLNQAKLLKESQGAQIVDLEAFGMPPCLIRKSDGSTLYATRDLATAEYRMATFNPTRLVYVVGSEQKLHFQQVFKVLELMGHSWASHYVHVDFGLIKFPDGKMSTRQGKIILLEDVLNQAEQEALRIIDQKQEERPEEKRLSQRERAEAARLIGMGAVMFFDLKSRRTKDILFDWNEILSFEGDSGPYLQYSSVRLRALIERAYLEFPELQDQEDQAPLLTTEAERELALSLLYFPAYVEAAAREFEPSIVSNALLDLAAVFNRFYMNVSIIKAEEHLRSGRLQLVKLCLESIEVGLGLLGIQCPKKM
jgi:arginyl-tRNA synthetase